MPPPKPAASLDVLIDRIASVAESTGEIRDLLQGADGAKGIIGRLDVIEHRLDVIERRRDGVEEHVAQLEQAHRAHSAIDAAVSSPSSRSPTGEHQSLVTITQPPPPSLNLWGAHLPQGFAKFLVVAVLLAAMFLAYSPAVNRAAEGWAAAQAAKMHQAPESPPRRPAPSPGDHP